MSGPALGIGRITIPYTVSGLTHESRVYCYNPQSSGGSWVIDLRPSVGGTINWGIAADAYSQTLSHILGTGVTVGTAVLEEWSSTGWLLRATGTVTMPNLSGPLTLAAQTTMTLRDTNFTRPKIVVMETNVPPPAKYSSPLAGGATYDAFHAEFLSTGTLGGKPYDWMTNQHGFFLSTSPFVSTRLTYNRKLERARGFA